MVTANGKLRPGTLLLKNKDGQQPSSDFSNKTFRIAFLPYLTRPIKVPDSAGWGLWSRSALTKKGKSNACRRMLADECQTSKMIEMSKDFEINGEFRVMENAELVYILTNSAKLVSKVKERETVFGEEYDIDDVLQQMTPARKRVAMAGIELYKRSTSKKEQRPQIRCSVDIYDMMQPIIGDNRTEESWAIFVNQASRVLKKIRISSGGLSATVVDVRVLLKEALLCDAACMMLCHNHPSGNNRPSSEDDRLTKRLKDSAEAINVKLLDHVIVCSNSYYSYADEGKL